MSIQFDGLYFRLFGEEFILRFYGMIIMFGAVAGGFLATREARRRNVDPEQVWDLMIWLVIGGVIGARLWHVFTPPPSSLASGISTLYYLQNPLDILAIWKGGLGIPGAVIGGAVALYFYIRRYGGSYPIWMDIVAPALALGQAIGRWGNYFNQELYGAPTSLPWAIFIDPVHRLAGFEQYETFHPLFLYESLWSFGNMALLLWFSRRFADRLKPGDVFLVYLLVYPLGRFLLDFLRLDASMLGGVNANQTFMLVVMVASLAVLAWRHLRSRQSPGLSVTDD